MDVENEKRKFEFFSLRLKKVSKFKVILFLILLNIITIIVSFYFLFFKKNNIFNQKNPLKAEKSLLKESKAFIEKKNDKERSFSSLKLNKKINLDKLIINLSTPEVFSQRFVQVNISIEVYVYESIEEINSKIPKIRNLIIDLFNSKKPSEVSHPEGREFIKEDIKNNINTFLINGKIKEVYFTSFFLSN
jgi:flagellar FliL protein